MNQNEQTDSLLFNTSELEIEASADNLPEVQLFIEEHLKRTDCSSKAQMQIGIAVEEIFINIVSYAYAPEQGKVTVRVEVEEHPLAVTITFVDHGIPYDPLAKEDPDITLSANDREIGGLGVFLVKKTMDDISYEYKNGKNILKIKKNIL